MASLHAASFYCITESELPSNGGTDYRTIYITLCVTFACLGFVGAVWHLVSLRASVVQSRELETRRRTKTTVNPVIIVSLAVANLLSCVGVTTRSTALLYTTTPIETSGNNSTVTPTVSYNTVIIGTIIEIFTNFNYTASVMWTLAYAIDVFAKFKMIAMEWRDSDPPSSTFYSLICWGFSVITTSAETLSIYISSDFPGKCAGETRLLWRYLSYYIPVIFVLLVNPIIYWRARAFAKRRIPLLTGSFTGTERDLVNAITFKFTVIVVVFAIVWTPNIVDSIMDLVLLIDSKEVHNKYRILFPLWAIEAILNPLQGLFNCFLYSKGNTLYRCLCCKSGNKVIQEYPNETSGLLRNNSGFCSSTNSYH